MCRLLLAFVLVPLTKTVLPLDVKYFIPLTGVFVGGVPDSLGWGSEKLREVSLKLLL